jgi:RNA polymerase sigma-70 factor, ECF subfamily
VSSVDEAMGRYAQGDATAFEQVYEAVAPRLEGYLRRHVRDRARIEDIVQQTFLQVHAARGTFIVGADVMPWAFAIARRLMIDSGRKARREEYLEMNDDDLLARVPNAAGIAGVASGEEILQAREAGARLSAAYGRLSEPQRAAFELVKTEGMSHAQAASVLGTSVTGVKLRVHRAYLALRAALGGARSSSGLATGLASGLVSGLASGLVSGLASGLPTGLATGSAGTVALLPKGERR